MELALRTQHRRDLLLSNHPHRFRRYATAPTLNSFSALIHNFYTSESSPSPAVHLTLDPESLEFTTYTAAQIGTTPRPDHLAFLPVASCLRVHDQDRAGLDLLASQLSTFSAQADKALKAEVAVEAPLATLHALLGKVSVMLDNVLEYVRAVAAGEREGDEKVGRALLETVGVVPTGVAPTASADGKAAGSKTFEEDFNEHLNTILMISYLSKLVLAESEISSRLNLLV